MTGFGSATLKNDKITLSVQIKSVNGRFLETRFRLPREYSSLEGEIKKLVASEIQRGTLDISIYRTLETKTAQIEVTPNIALAKAYVKAAKVLNDEAKLGGSISLEALLRVPEMMQVSGETELADWERAAVLEATKNALKSCIEEKKREGASQYQIFSELLTGLAKFVSDIKNKKSEIDSKLKTRLDLKLKALGEGIQVDPQRLAQEVVFLLEKADIEEEISRAETHLKAYKEALKEKVSVGKKLEFYTQELHREVNTMGAKTQALEVTLDVIEAKTCIERLREQVQNVE